MNLRFASVACIALLQGCVSMSPRYQNATSGPPRSVQPLDGYHIAFVEFGEQGSYLDTSQVAAAYNLVRQSKKPLVITYVHGWHNDSGSDDVRRFEDFLHDVTNTPLVKEQGFDVIGVFLGWRGEITNVPVITEFTFYSRKTAAERLANNFDCFDAISSVAEAARVYHTRENRYSILIGHSFGGLVVERAVAHALDAKMHGRDGRGSEMPADLTLVWNPASDSILSRQIIAALSQWQTENTRPLFASVTSTADKATGVIFPIAMTLSSISKAFPKVHDPVPKSDDDQSGDDLNTHLRSERSYYTSTPGHKKELINHDTTPSTFPVHFPPGTSAVTLNLSHNLNGDVVALPTDSGGIELWQLRQLPTAVNVPYWDIQVDKRIIKSHGDVWNPKAEALLAGLFRIANPLSPDQHRREATFTRRDFRRNGYRQPQSRPSPAPVTR
jgi:hypothetical protein